VCVSVLVCACGRMCERVWTCVYDATYFWCCCVRCCDGDQYDAVSVTSAPRRARRPMVGDRCWSARKTKRRTRSAGFHLSLALVVGQFSFFVFVFVLLFFFLNIYIHINIFLFLFLIVIIIYYYYYRTHNIYIIIYRYINLFVSCTV